MLKPFLLLSAALLFAVAPAPTPVLAAGGPPQDNSSKPAGSSEKAKKLYNRDCAFCHGENGNGKGDFVPPKGTTLADWTDPKSLAALQDKDMAEIIRKGKGDVMPAEDESRAKDEDIRALIAYIRGFSKNQPAAPADAAPAAPAPASPGR